MTSSLAKHFEAAQDLCRLLSKNGSLLINAAEEKAGPPEPKSYPMKWAKNPGKTVTRLGGQFYSAVGNAAGSVGTGFTNTRDAISDSVGNTFKRLKKRSADASPEEKEKLDAAQGEAQKTVDSELGKVKDAGDAVQDAGKDAAKQVRTTLSTMERITNALDTMEARASKLAEDTGSSINNAIDEANKKIEALKDIVPKEKLGPEAPKKSMGDRYAEAKSAAKNAVDDAISAVRRKGTEIKTFAENQGDKLHDKVEDLAADAEESYHLSEKYNAARDNLKQKTDAASKAIGGAVEKVKGAMPASSKDLADTNKLLSGVTEEVGNRLKAQSERADSMDSKMAKLEASVAKMQAFDESVMKAGEQIETVLDKQGQRLQELQQQINALSAKSGEDQQQNAKAYQDVMKEVQSVAQETQKLTQQYKQVFGTAAAGAKSETEAATAAMSN